MANIIVNAFCLRVRSLSLKFRLKLLVNISLLVDKIVLENWLFALIPSDLDFLLSTINYMYGLYMECETAANQN